jgi:hypothetical protein
MVHLIKPEWVVHGEAGIYSLTASAERVATGGGDHKVRIECVCVDMSWCVFVRVQSARWAGEALCSASASLHSRFWLLKRRDTEAPSRERLWDSRAQHFLPACIGMRSASTLHLDASGATRCRQHLSADGWK